MGYFPRDADVTKRERDRALDTVQYADPAVTARLAAAKDMGRTATANEARNAAEGVQVPDVPAPREPMMTFQQWATSNYPGITSQKYIPREQFAVVQQGFQDYQRSYQAQGQQDAGRFDMEMQRAKLMRDMQNDAGGKAPTIPGNLPAQVGLATLRPELFGQERVDKLISIMHTVYGKDFDGSAGRKAASKSSSTRSTTQSKIIDPSMMQDVIFGNKYKTDPESVESRNLDGATGFLAEFQEDPTAAWVKMLHWTKAIGAVYDPNDPGMAELGRMKGGVERLLRIFRPDPYKVLEAVDAGELSPDDAEIALKLMLTPEEIQQLRQGTFVPPQQAQPANKTDGAWHPMDVRNWGEVARQAFGSKPKKE